MEDYPFVFRRVVLPPFDMDLFAYDDNRKFLAFKLKFPYVNAFLVSWTSNANLLAPPIALVPRVLHHLEASCGQGGSRDYPWTSAAFFPCIVLQAREQKVSTAGTGGTWHILLSKTWQVRF